MNLLQLIGIAEAVTILMLAEPTLNRMSPCAPLLVRIAFHAIAIGSALRLYHLLSGHVPSWSALVQMAGFSGLLLLDHLRRKNKLEDQRRKKKRVECRLYDLSKPPSGFS